MQMLSAARIAAAKRAFVTRRVPLNAMRTLITSPARLRAGDLVLARVTEIGHHTSVELPTSRKASLAINDEVLLAFGNRYAPDQFEAIVPDDLGHCHMVAAGGIAALARTWHEKIVGPTAIQPVGLVGGTSGEAINLADFAIKHEASGPIPPMVVVYGTSMNAGKTTTAASLVRGLAGAGFAVGAAKVTGTGAGNDLWSMIDAGAVSALDFTDAGFATTYLAPVDAIIAGAQTMLRNLGSAGAEIAVVEVADGLFQQETAALAASAEFRSMTAGVLFAAGDSMGAVAGAEHLRSLGHQVLALSGIMTRSPLARDEAAIDPAPVYGVAELMDPEIASQLVAHIAVPRSAVLARRA